jgi:hypothetical protein
MWSYEAAKDFAREKLLQAEKALDDYGHGKEFDHDQLRRLVEDVHAARENFLILHSGLTAGDI